MKTIFPAGVDVWMPPVRLNEFNPERLERLKLREKVRHGPGEAIELPDDDRVDERKTKAFRCEAKLLSTKKRGATWRAEGVVNKRYIRISLKTRDASTAKKAVSEIELALIDGKDSKRWIELRRILQKPRWSRLLQWVITREAESVSRSDRA